MTLAPFETRIRDIAAQYPCIDVTTAVQMADWRNARDEAPVIDAEDSLAIASLIREQTAIVELIDEHTSGTNRAAKVVAIQETMVLTGSGLGAARAAVELVAAERAS